MTLEREFLATCAHWSSNKFQLPAASADGGLGFVTRSTPCTARKVSLPVDFPAWKEGNLLQPLESTPASRERVVPTEWQVRAVLGDCISKAKVITVQEPQYRQYALISDFLAEYTRGSSIAHELDQGST